MAISIPIHHRESKSQVSWNSILPVFKNFYKLMKASATEFMEDNGMKLSASLSYYTVFSLPPLLIIIISLSGLVWGKEAVAGEIFAQINSIIGEEAALQIQQAIANVEFSGENIFAAIIGGFILLMGASGVFAEIQSSINYVWGLKAKPNRGFMKYLKNRLMSFSMIGSAGFLLLVSLIVNTVLEILNRKLMAYFPDVAVILFNVLNLLVIFIVISLLFYLIFKTLPDGKIPRRYALIGSAFTAILFMMGKLAIGAYLGNSSVATLYGAAGSLVIILVWVYYSAIILFFGTAFTKSLAMMHGKTIKPNDFAVMIKKPEKEENPS